jgi:rhodanese-like protein
MTSPAIPTGSPVLRVPPADPADAAAWFAARLAFHTDVADVHASLAGGSPGFVLVDSRGAAAWVQGRIPGAVHLPTAELPARARSLLDPAVPVVTYCWGPGCDGRPGPPWPWPPWATGSRRCSAAWSTGSGKGSRSTPTRAPGAAHPTP